MSALVRTEQVRLLPRAGDRRDPAPGLRCLAAVVGPTSLEVALTDARARVLASARRPVGLAHGPDAVVSAVLDVVRGMRADGAVGVLHGAGVALPAAAAAAERRRGGTVALAAGWGELPLVLARRLGCPVRLGDDTHVMALGEVHAGAARGARDVLFVALDEGVRCGLVLAGAVHRGARGTAGQVGHVPVRGTLARTGVGDDMPLCPCGRTGCLDAYVGAPALARAARELASSGCSPLLAVRLAAAGRLSPADLAAAAAAGDEPAAGLVRRTGRLLGEHLAGLVRFCDPAVVVLGGEVAAGLGEPLLDQVRGVVDARCPAPAGQRSVVLSALGARAGVVGAARLARDGALALA